MRGPTSRPIQPSGTSVPSCSRALGARRRSGRPAPGPSGSSSRQSDDSAFSSARRASSTPSSSTSESPVGIALRAEEAEAHRAADQQRVGGVEEPVDQRDLVGHLGAAEHHDQRPLGRLDDRAQRGHLALEQQARPPPGAGARPRRRSTRARGARRRRRRSRRRRRARPARARARGRSRSRRAPSACSRAPARRPARSRSAPRRTSGPITSGAWCTGASISSPSRARHRPQRGLRVAPLRPAQVRAEDQPRAALEQQLDRGQRRADARVVGDLAVLERHVEVDPGEHALALCRSRGRGRCACRIRSWSPPQATGAPARTRWARSTTRFE